MDDRHVLTPSDDGRDQAADSRPEQAARDLSVRELAQRWWRPATVVLVLAAAVV